MEGEASGTKRYWVEIGGQRYGPADLSTLTAWKAEGRVQPDTVLVEEGTEVRRSARELPELFPPDAAYAAPPPFSQAPTDPPANRRSCPVWAAVVLVVLGLCVFGTVILAAILFPVFTQARYTAKRTVGLSNLKQLSLGVIMYATDYDDRFPPDMSSAQAVKPWIDPYVKNDRLFVTMNPKGGEVLGNPKLSRRLTADVKEPAQTGLLYDSQEWSEGKGIAAFVDGSARTLPMQKILESLNQPLRPAKKR